MKGRRLRRIKQSSLPINRFSAACFFLAIGEVRNGGFFG